jgi:hemoglobin-like flavoprotein
MSVSKHPLSNVGPELQDLPVDQAVIGRLQRSFELMSARGDELADRFYARLFASYPQLRSMFPPDMTGQKQKILRSLSTVVDHLRSPNVVRAHLEHLGRSHVAYGTLESHYPPVCAALVASMAEVSGTDWSPGLQADWTQAIDLVAAIMIRGAREAAKPG